MASTQAEVLTHDLLNMNKENFLFQYNSYSKNISKLLFKMESYRKIIRFWGSL
jgi:hypothetical protein